MLPGAEVVSVPLVDEGNEGGPVLVAGQVGVQVDDQCG